MLKNISFTNLNFNYLKNSSEFLNFILNNITSCVLLLDKDLKLHAFNEPLKTVFSNYKEEHLLYKKCGNVLGCAFAVEQMVECGNTTNCETCELREKTLLSYIENKEIYKQPLTREFYTTSNHKELKHLLFSTRTFVFEQDTYIILIIEDITQLVNQEILIEKQQRLIERQSS